MLLALLPLFNVAKMVLVIVVIVFMRYNPLEQVVMTVCGDLLLGFRCPMRYTLQNKSPQPGNNATSNDQCQADGSCVGVDLCANITCPAPTSVCQLSVVCDNGICPAFSSKPDGILCNTTGAADIAPCQYYECRGGSCIVANVTDHTVTCNDHNNNTIDDTCVGGEFDTRKGIIWPRY